MGSKKFRSLVEIREIIDRMQASGLSRWAFSKLEGIAYTTLASFEKRLTKAEGGSELNIPVTKKVPRRKEAFFEISPELVSGASVFTLRRGIFELEFSLSDLPLVLSELEKRA